MLRLGIDDVLVGGINHGLETIAFQGDEPVGIDDAVGGARARRPADRVVVLSPAVDVVKRRGIVQPDLVELRQRQIAEPLPGAAAVKTLIDAAIATGQQVVGVVGINPQHVIVDVLVLLANPTHGLAAVVADLHPGVHRVEAIDHLGICKQFVVVLPTAGHIVGALFPVLAGIGGPVQTAILASGVHHRVDRVRIGRGDRQANAPDVTLRQSIADLAPGMATIRGFAQARLGTAVDHGPDVPTSLIGRGKHHIGIARIQMHLGNTRVLRGLEGLAPGQAAIAGDKQAAFATG